MRICSLCDLLNLTDIYYEDDTWRICECATCSQILVIYKIGHTMVVNPGALCDIIEIIREIFGENVKLRMKQRSIPDHFHFHIII